MGWKCSPSSTAWSKHGHWQLTDKALLGLCDTIHYPVNHCCLPHLASMDVAVGQSAISVREVLQQGRKVEEGSPKHFLLAQLWDLYHS